MLGVLLTLPKEDLEAPVGVAVEFALFGAFCALAGASGVCLIADFGNAISLAVKHFVVLL